MEPIEIEPLKTFDFYDATPDESYVTDIYVVVNSNIYKYIQFLREKVNEKKTLEDELSAEENKCRKLLSALQYEHSALLEKHSALEETLARETNWHNEKKKLLGE